MDNIIKSVLARYDILSKHEIEEVINSAIERKYKKGAYFLKANELTDELGFLLEGVFRYYTINKDGNEDTSVFIMEGNFFTELTSFHGKQPAEGYIQAETDSTVLVYEREVYQRIVSTIKGMEFVFKRIAQDTMSDQFKLFREIATMSATEAYLLLMRDYASLVSRVPDNHLASYLGITKHSLSRIKKKITDSRD